MSLKSRRKLPLNQGFAHVVGLLILLFCVSRGAAVEGAMGNEAGQNSIAVLSIGSPIDWYDTGRDGCDEQDTPDEPARAFRDSADVIHFFATGSINRAMLGSEFQHLTHTCDIAFQGAKDASPEAYNDNGWLTSFYADGNTVFALIHNELHGLERPDLCPSHGGQNCTEVSITAAVSKDGGYHFSRYAGDAGLVAALPYHYQAKSGEFIGYANPSNIVQMGAFYYVFVTSIDPYDQDRSGVCLLRTSTLSDPSSWRAWNGAEFATKFVNPYRSKVSDPRSHACTTIAPDTLFSSLGSVTWSPSRASYLLVMRFQRWNKVRHGEIPGAYLFESRDLIHWSRPVLLFSDAEAGGAEQLYPSLIDPNSPDQNFTTIGDSPTLYTKISKPGLGYSGWNLVARQVKLRF